MPGMIITVSTALNPNRSRITETFLSGPGPDTETERNSEISFLKRALGRLSEEKREVLVLSRYQDMKYSEIGDVLGCSEGAVKVRVHRAMQTLTKIYHDLTGENTL